MLDRKLNGEMVRLARNRRRMTQTDLAAASGVPQTAISRTENDASGELGLEQLKSIARCLQFPVAFFYEQDTVYRQPISLHPAAFRKRASVSARDESAVIALGNHYVLQLRRLLDAVDLNPEFETPKFEIVKTRSGAAEFARAISTARDAAIAVRAGWQLGDGPIADLTSYVEASGIMVIKADFGAADVDGFTLRPVGMDPVIFLNQNRPADRMRFSLAHEFGHAVLHAFPDEAMEKEANEFASELLMPRNGILPDLRRGLSIPALGKLKLKWRVSIASLIYRASSVDLIEGEAARRLWIDFGPYRTREPVEFDIAPEQPRLAADLIRAHTQDLGFTIVDIANAVTTFPNEFAQMHGLVPTGPRVPEKPKLRLVPNFKRQA